MVGGVLGCLSACAISITAVYVNMPYLFTAQLITGDGHQVHHFVVCKKDPQGKKKKENQYLGSGMINM